MMSMEAIMDLANDQGKRAHRLKYVPWFIESREVIDTFPPFPFPNIGNYEPSGWGEIDRAFVDKTGRDNQGPE